MSNEDRARQFLPFDSLKGLQEALRLKEYEHERSIKGDISDDLMNKISENMLNTESTSIVSIRYFYDGYYKNIEGRVKINYNERCLKIENMTLLFDMIFDYEILEK